MRARQRSSFAAGEEEDEPTKRFATYWAGKAFRLWIHRAFFPLVSVGICFHLISKRVRGAGPLNPAHRLCAYHTPDQFGHPQKMDQFGHAQEEINNSPQS
jgi:hypothetical protein